MRLVRGGGGEGGEPRRACKPPGFQSRVLNQPVAAAAAAAAAAVILCSFSLESDGGYSNQKEMNHTNPVFLFFMVKRWDARAHGCRRQLAAAAGERMKIKEDDAMEIRQLGR